MSSTKDKQRYYSIPLANNGYFEREHTNNFDICVDLYGIKKGHKVERYRVFYSIYHNGEEAVFRSYEVPLAEAMALYEVLSNRVVGYYDAFPDAIDEDEYVYGLNSDGDINC